MTDTAAQIAAAKDLLAAVEATQALQVQQVAALAEAVRAIVLGPPTRTLAAGWGDGVKDATAAIQMEIDALAVGGGVVVIPAGEYLVNADPAKCIKARSGVAIQIDGALRVKPSSMDRTYAVLVENVSKVDIAFGEAGQIIGDRLEHTFLDDSTPTDERGMGIAIYGSQNVTVTGGRISRCTGDGIVVGRDSSDVTIQDVVSTENRRQGVTIGRQSRVTIKNCTITKTGALLGKPGTKPMAGIDIEPDPSGSMLCEDVLIENCLIADNEGNGIETNAIAKDGVIPTLRRVAVRDCELARNAFGMYAQRVADLTLEGNSAHHNRWHGIRLLSGTTTAKPAQNNVFESNYGTTARASEIVAIGFVQARDLKREDSAGVCVAGENTYR